MYREMQRFSKNTIYIQGLPLLRFCLGKGVSSLHKPVASKGQQWSNIQGSHIT